MDDTDPDAVRAVVARMEDAVRYLRNGQYKSGWAAYEARWGFPRYEGNNLPVPFPLARSILEIEGRRLLLWFEQGLGDMMLMLRFVPMVAAKAAHVVVVVQPPLKRLAMSLAGGATIISIDDSFEETDVQYPLMSLPFLLRTRVATIPPGIPYLRPNDALIRQWRVRVGTTDGFHVGLAWHGNPVREVNRYRTIPITQLAPLLMLPGIEFHILHDQVDDQDRAFLSAFPNVHLYMDGLTDMAETAALIMNLDLVISVCTSVAHLAGALGRPLWVALRHDPYWVWMLNRDDSPWYPTARLFRQTTEGDWTPVIAGLRDALWKLHPTIAV